MEIWIPLIKAFIVVAVLAFLTLFIFLCVWKDKTKICNILKNFSVLIFSILFSFLILEFFGVYFLFNWMVTDLH